MQLTSKISGLLIVVVISFSACKTSETFPTAPTDQVSLVLRQSARLSSDVSLRVDSIQDSRCPANALCAWAGQAIVKMLLAKNQDSTVVRLRLSPGVNQNSNQRSDSTNVLLRNQSYKIILREVNPYPDTPSDDRPQTVVVRITKV